MQMTEFFVDLPRDAVLDSTLVLRPAAPTHGGRDSNPVGVTSVGVNLMFSLHSYNSKAMTARKRVAGVRGVAYAGAMAWCGEGPLTFDPQRNIELVTSVRHGYRGGLPLDP
jgi:hypothetical protein